VLKASDKSAQFETKTKFSNYDSRAISRMIQQHQSIMITDPKLFTSDM